MATYMELHDLFNNGALMDRVSVAVIISAQKIASNAAPFATPTAEQTAWARQAFAGPQAEARTALRAVLATNATASVSAIQSASDSAIQTAVDAAVPILAGG